MLQAARESQMINETERLGGPYPPPPRPQCQELHLKLVWGFFVACQEDAHNLQGGFFFGP